MSLVDPRIALEQMRSHAQEAVALLRGKTQRDLHADRTLSLAILRLLEIVGEAANRVPPDRRAQYPAIPWSQIIALRNRLIHAYDQVDLEIVWTVVHQDLPALVRSLGAILGDG
jgi:uncharacterized protein with HEPN domain